MFRTGTTSHHYARPHYCQTLDMYSHLNTEIIHVLPSSPQTMEQVGFMQEFLCHFHESLQFL